MALPFDFYKIGLEHRELVSSIIEYFSVNPPKGSIAEKDTTAIKDKTVIKFLDLYYKDPQGSGYIIQPSVVNKICDILVGKDMIMKTRSDGGIGINNNYLCNLRLDDNGQIPQKDINMVNSIVFGFQYIYEQYKDIVVPLVWDRGNGNYSAGTAFKFNTGIVTAKHCITDTLNLMIKGFAASELKNSNIYISENDGVDVAFIDLHRPVNMVTYIEDGEVLQDVLVMGYPKIPSFTDLITAEKSSIAAKADARQTTTTGSIAAFGKQYLMGCNMMLITAKISGGNSGGPVINDRGSIIGITSNLTAGEGDYDDLGYGVVSPVDYLIEIVNGKKREYKVSNDFFRDWAW